MIPAIKTKYNDILFKSRLEARWAAFFDLMNWKWEYEPIDCNGWIPDFVIYGKKFMGYDKEPEDIILLVEVKPFHKLKQYDIKKYVKAINNTIYKSDEILLLGSTINIISSNECSIGWLNDRTCFDEDYNFDKCLINKLGGFYHYSGYYGCRITGEYEGDHNNSCKSNEIKKRWNIAYERTKYR